MAIKIISENRKARHDYEIVEVLEAGIVLMGSEVKSLRETGCQLKDSYVVFRNDEAYLQGVHISPYKASSYNNHSPERVRKLLLHRDQLKQVAKKIQAKGLSCVPLKVFFKKGMAKVEIALVRGKKSHDKRETIKKREASREVERRLRHSTKS
jgi:SsrA-binding protein